MTATTTRDRFTGSRRLPAVVDRTEILRFPEGGSIWVGGKAAGWHFPGVVLDLRPEEEEPSYGVRLWPVFSGSPGSWTVDPVLANQAIEFIAGEIALRRDVLVRCGSGVERSPALVVLYLVRKKGMSPADAYALVRRARPQVVEELDMLPLTDEERTR
jgi:hypothetical protein